MSKLFGSKNHNFEVEALEIHNVYRREHGAPPLTLNKELCKISQKWAEELAKRDEMDYSNNDKYGESIFCGRVLDSDTKITAQDCVDKWYSEINDFSFGREPTVLNCGHFTQIVWKTTKELGIGRAKSKSGKIYIVANYYPPGNYTGQFAKNVPPPGAFQFSPNLDDEALTYISPNSNESSTIVDRKNEKEEIYLSQSLKNSMVLNENSFREKCLESHNKYRRLHGAPSLTLNANISDFAQTWADTLAKKETMYHRQQDQYGENLFFVWSSNPDFALHGNEPVDKWYSEIKDYDFSKESNDISTGHFTQVVWKDTKEMGVAMAKSKTGKVYVVANYNPPGNFIGRFKENVLPLQTSK